MTATAALGAAIASKCRELWGTLIVEPHKLVTAYDNQPLAMPTTRWCRLSVEILSTRQVSTGSANAARFRAEGRMVAQLFEPLGNGTTQGDGTQWGMVDTIDVAFRALSTTAGQDTAPVYLRFMAPAPIGPPEMDSETWWRRRVEIPFRADYFGRN